MTKVFMFGLLVQVVLTQTALADVLYGESIRPVSYFVTTQASSTEGWIQLNKNVQGIKLDCEPAFQSEGLFMVNCESDFAINTHFNVNISTAPGSVGLGFLYGRSIEGTSVINGAPHQNMVTLECRTLETAHGFPDLDCHSQSFPL